MNRAGTPIGGATASTYVPVAADVGNTLTVSVIAANSGGSSAPAISAATSAVTAAAAAFPGQAGNPVGYAAALGYPGSLTPMSSSGPFVSGTPGNPTVYAFKDFDAGTGSVALDSSLSWITFVGCRFQSNNVSFGNLIFTGASNITLSYCSIVPRVALVGATPPGGGVWPSNGAGAGVIDQASGPTGYQIADSNGYQYGINLSTAGTGGPVTIDHCDIWGGQNMINFYATTQQMTVRDCWIHDWADAGGTGGPPRQNPAHQDGPGYLNATTGPTNVTIDHNTICGIANGNMIAFQSRTGGSSNMTITNNYFCGGSYCVRLSVGSNVSFTDNLFATDIPWQWGPIYPDPTSVFSANGNLWRRNKLKVRPGTVPYPGSNLAWTSADEGKFMLPNSTLSTVDFTG